MWCRGVKCPREKPKHIDQGCGFFLCTGKLKKDFEARTRSLSFRNHGGGLTMKQFLQRPLEWSMGINMMTRFLGSPSANMTAEYARVPQLSNATQEGRAYLALAKRRLEAMDFVLVLELLSLGYAEYFKVSVPHTNRNSVEQQSAAVKEAPLKTWASKGQVRHKYDPTSHGALTSEERRMIEELNDLDMELYRFAKNRYYAGERQPRAPDTMPSRLAGNWYWNVKGKKGAWSGSEEQRKAVPRGTGTCRHAVRSSSSAPLRRPDTQEAAEKIRQREALLLLEQQKLRGRPPRKQKQQ